MLAEVRVCTLSESQDLEHSDFSENYDTTRVKIQSRLKSFWYVKMQLRWKPFWYVKIQSISKLF